MAQRGSYAKGVAKREEILSTALEVIARNGYRRTSVRELADAVGLSQAGLLHYFSSKEELFTEVLRKRDDVDARRRDLVSDPFDALTDTISHNADVGGLVRLYVQLSADATDGEHPANPYFTERYATLRTTLTQAIAAEQDAGRLRPDVSAAQLATVVIATMDGLQTQWLLDPSIDMVGAVESVIALATTAEPHR
ncbi:TetR/AcrR family transcriptional regulator [Microbacterium sp. MPKO10]|uniref:TetR/AcrR family transcriptional regulator n=1 Tax=Microbacterium sp. MPKO10 TaxID=2989818 RepID=UPI002236568C|nr:TetR/AcrR family transcriptional regulator [Microbacterium sp. MPKO10]MCW4459176.1 TetR/AcrR family transcriptional regulator [Microbacterium sp. MPKO10]